MASDDKKLAIWLFGRGVSCNCGLTWTVPGEWKALPRIEQIAHIEVAIRAEMDRLDVDMTCIRTLLNDLASRTPDGHRHLFGTTNWDYLLQREIEVRSDAEWEGIQPAWLANSHVYHLNGTVEKLANNSHRSAILLEEDDYRQRELPPKQMRSSTT